MVFSIFGRVPAESGERSGKVISTDHIQIANIGIYALKNNGEHM